MVANPVDTASLRVFIMYSQLVFPSVKHRNFSKTIEKYYMYIMISDYVVAS